MIFINYTLILEDISENVKYSMLSSSYSNLESPLRCLLKGEQINFFLKGSAECTLHRLSGLIFRALSRLGIEFIHDIIMMVLEETFVNFTKANAKRIYFKENQYDIHSIEDYEVAMTSFSHDVLANWKNFHQKNESSFSQTSLRIKIQDDSIFFQMENPSEMTPCEYERIKDRFQSFQKHRNIQEAFSEIEDSAEGAGLGIFLNLSLLANAGISAENYRIYTKGNDTCCSLNITKSLIEKGFASSFHKKISMEIERLPTFIEHINEIVRLCKSSTSSLENIAQEIAKDPSLSAQILCWANSPAYMGALQCTHLKDALKIVGLNIIQNLLTATGVFRLLEKHCAKRELKMLWRESQKVSFFATRLAKDSSVKEDVGTAGILSAIGKIILVSLDQETTQEIQNMLSRRLSRNIASLEESIIGISHAEIGAKITEKWNFPASLTSAIRNQYHPYLAETRHASLVSTLYTAIMLKNYTTEVIDYNATEPDILHEFGLDSEERFCAKAKHLQEEFEQSFSSQFVL